jgi:peptidyl-dipeptidase A
LEWKNNISQFKIDWSFNSEAVHINSTRLKELYNIIASRDISEALDEGQAKERVELIEDMTRTYSTAKICPYNEQHCNLATEGLSLQPDLENIFHKNIELEYFDERMYVWQKWRDATGRKVRSKFIDYIKLSNAGAIATGKENVKNYADYWLNYASYDKEELAALWGDVKEFFQDLHAFVRHKLRKNYGEDKIDAHGPIPAHILPPIGEIYNKL